jgi:Zn-dependent M28 family amino/carboxypeptidase
MGTFNVPELRPLLGRLNAGIGLNVDYKFERDLEENAFTRSDHYPFALAGLPAFWFFTGFHPDYHTPADSAEKINYAKMEKIARLVYRTAWALADAGERPRVVAVPVPPPAPAERPASPLPAAR